MSSPHVSAWDQEADRPILSGTNQRWGDVRTSENSIHLAVFPNSLGSLKLTQFVKTNPVQSWAEGV